MLVVEAVKVDERFNCPVSMVIGFLWPRKYGFGGFKKLVGIVQTGL